MANIGLVIRPGSDEAAALAQHVARWAEREGHALLCDIHTSHTLQRGKGNELSEVACGSDVIVTLGGDGTLIGVARLVESSTTIVVGVKFGRLGFLTEIAPDDVFDTINAALKGQADVNVRQMLLCEVLRAGKTIFSAQALNDGVIHKGALDRLLDLDVAVDGEEVMRLRADGLIAATPTGSTAYSMAAGGSIVHPSLAVMMVTPICPHALTNRPLILNLDSVLTVTVPPYDGSVMLSVDGQSGCELSVGDTVRFTRCKHAVRIARAKGLSYFQVLRRKLNWGVQSSREEII